MNSNTTTLTPGATPKPDPLAPCGKLTMTIDMAALKGMDMHGLFTLYQDMTTLSGVTYGLSSSPRNDDRHAGKLLCEMAEWFDAWRDAIFNIANAAAPTDPEAAKWRAYIRLNFLASCVDELSEVAVIAAESVREMERAERDEQLAEHLGRSRNAA